MLFLHLPLLPPLLFICKAVRLFLCIHTSFHTHMLQAGRADGIDLLPEYIEFARNNVNKLVHGAPQSPTGTATSASDSDDTEEQQPFDKSHRAGAGAGSGGKEDKDEQSTKERETDDEHPHHPRLDLSNCTFEVRNCFVPDLQQRTYDRIHVGACCPTPRLEGLLALLKKGGILVTPLEDALVKIRKTETGATETEKLAAVRYSDLKIPSDAEVKEAQLALERKMSTTINVPEDTFVSDFANLLNNRQYADVTFVIGDQQIAAHKFILKVRSAHFRAMFDGGLRESQANVVQLPDTDYNAFMACLQFIYSGSCPAARLSHYTATAGAGVGVENVDAAVDILVEANKRDLHVLKAQCEATVAASLAVDNVAYIFQIASTTNAQQLRTLALDYMLSRFEEVSKTACFAEMDRALVVEVTQEACKLLFKTRGN
eukprot:TRINITY_DN4921_c1_g1_i3.p1 TRINITY_DN4921_c1_g1~~TRINITY_DN4921_c1_g1_i3.p1  ORF type:complete len:430 (+),score=75.40 TRINITY_DN4921_c1_g1_i3:106-1395(+)